MSSLTGGPYPPPLDDSEADGLSATVKDWTIGHGLAIRTPPSLVPSEVDPSGVSAINAPVTLFPSPFPRVCFNQARAAQKAYNELYAAVSRDESFLAEIVKGVVDGDDFIRNLWDIHLKVKREGYAQVRHAHLDFLDAEPGERFLLNSRQPLSLGMFRSDYMVHQDASTSPVTLQAKQVEFNTIASSAPRPETYGFHRFLSRTEYPLLEHAIPSGSLDLPANESVAGLAAGIKAAFEAYSEPQLGHTKCVIFLVQGGERNVFDQRHLEYEIAKATPPVPVFRLAFRDVLSQTSVADTPQRQLLYHLPNHRAQVYEVAVIYLRAGYGPGDYPDQAAWDARYQLERSAAIKCPTILNQLAGTKKVQQVLATPRPASAPSMLGRFIKDDTESALALWKTFTNIFPMDTSEVGLEARRKALDPELSKSYVLKPQREGGGNNVYRGAIPAFLKAVPESHWSTYILMELITPPPVSNLIFRNGQLERGGVICELGIYGTCIWNHESGEVQRNEEAGYLLRTKADQSEEGGVAAGFGCMDSCALV